MQLVQLILSNLGLAIGFALAILAQRLGNLFRSVLEVTAREKVLGGWLEPVRRATRPGGAGGGPSPAATLPCSRWRSRAAAWRMRWKAMVPFVPWPAIPALLIAGASWACAVVAEAACFRVSALAPALLPDESLRGLTHVLVALFGGLFVLVGASVFPYLP